jgi:hypothetical protein
MMPIDRPERLARATAARGRRHRGAGLLLIALGVGCVLAVGLVLFLLSRAGRDVNTVSSAVGPLVAGVTVWFVARGRRMRASGAERVLAEDQRAPIVYLRPFGVDRAELIPGWTSPVRVSPLGGVVKTYEERLARTLRSVGPLVAIGDPTESLPVLGASRLYASDEEWQQRVGELTSRAGAVILHTGEGDGLAWEVHHVIRLDSPGRLILSLPLSGARGRPARQDRYDGFRRRFADAFPRSLPESIGHSQFLYFDADWTPRLLGERGVALPGGESAPAQALRRLAKEFKITWAPLWVRFTVYLVAVLATVSAVGAVT